MVVSLIGGAPMNSPVQPRDAAWRQPVDSGQSRATHVLAEDKWAVAAAVPDMDARGAAAFAAHERSLINAILATLPQAADESVALPATSANTEPAPHAHVLAAYGEDWTSDATDLAGDRSAQQFVI